MQPDPSPHILIVDDDARLRKLLRKYLEDQGWIVTAAKDAADARAKLAFFIFDLMILDVMMPGETGVDFAAAIRGADHVPPILMLTAMGEVGDRIRGLEAGADDYLPKPFEPRELVLRIRNILGRTQVRPQARALSFGEFSYLPSEATLTRDGQPVYLTESEAMLLAALAASAGIAVSRTALAESIGERANERSVDVQVTRLRKKIEPEPGKPVYIQTVRGEGYLLRVAYV